MKLLLSLLLISFNVQAGLIQISYHQDQKALALSSMNFFEVNYGIPSKLIKLKLIKKCEPSAPRFLDLCINKKGELTEFSHNKTKLIINSFKIFRKEVKNEN